MNHTTYIFTYGKLELATGAAKSIRKFCKHDTQIILIDATKTIINGPFDNIIHDYFPKWMGPMFVRHIHHSGPVLCIDDDVRLVSCASLKDRYAVGNFKPPNGHMIVALSNVQEPLVSYTLLTQKRMNKNYKCKDLDEILLYLGNKNKSEHIDSIWIHIDKGSNTMTESRQNLIDYIDR